MNLKLFLISIFISTNIYSFGPNLKQNNSSLLSQLETLEKNLYQPKNTISEKKNESPDLIKEKNQKKKNDYNDDANSKMTITFVSSKKVLEELTQQILSNFINQLNNGPSYFYNIQTDATALMSHKEELTTI